MPLREYPEVVAVAVGALIIRDKRILLVRRRTEPGRGRWSVPGGMVEVGESLAEAVAREVMEECSVAVGVGELAAVVEQVEKDPAGKVKYHWVILDFHAELLHGSPVAASDALETRWVKFDEVDRYPLTPALARLLRLAQERGWEAGPFCLRM